MKALTWHGKEDMLCEQVPDFRIEDGRAAIIKVTACAMPSGMLAEQHRKMAEPGSSKDRKPWPIQHALR